jgi:hypothetical protein
MVFSSRAILGAVLSVCLTGSTARALETAPTGIQIAEKHTAVWSHDVFSRGYVKEFVMAGPPRPEVEKVKGRRSDTVLPTVDHFSSDLGQQDAPDIYDGSKGSMLQMVDKTDGTESSITELPSTPVLDGMIAADGRVFLSLKDGSVLCLVGE